MIRKQRPTFSSAELDLQLSQVSELPSSFKCVQSGLESIIEGCVAALTFANSQLTLDPSSGTSENLEALAPLIKSIQDSDSEQLYLRSLDTFVEEKEREIEKICQGNYEVGHGFNGFRSRQ